MAVAVDQPSQPLAVAEPEALAVAARALNISQRSCPEPFTQSQSEQKDLAEPEALAQ